MGSVLLLTKEDFDIYENALKTYRGTLDPDNPLRIAVKNRLRSLRRKRNKIFSEG